MKNNYEPCVVEVFTVAMENRLLAASEVSAQSSDFEKNDLTSEDFWN